jgi:DNA-binding NarL/FixJ family response regulator
MAITVGTDTYISLADANTYVSNNYPKTSTEYTAWTDIASLTDADKEMYLKKACKKIDRQMLRGIKTLATQTLEFPRAIHTDYYNTNYPNTVVRYTADWVVEESVSQSVKDAQVEEALSLILQGANANKRADLQAQGVKTFSLGNMSETYNKSTTSGTRLLSAEAKELLRYYLAGGVMIR